MVARTLEAFMAGLLIFDDGLIYRF
jgi:hypothetical protein